MGKRVIVGWEVSTRLPRLIFGNFAGFRLEIKQSIQLKITFVRALHNYLNSLDPALTARIAVESSFSIVAIGRKSSVFCDLILFKSLTVDEKQNENAVPLIAVDVGRWWRLWCRPIIQGLWIKSIPIFMSSFGLRLANY